MSTTNSPIISTLEGDHNSLTNESASPRRTVPQSSIVSSASSQETKELQHELVSQPTTRVNPVCLGDPTLDGIQATQILEKIQNSDFIDSEFLEAFDTALSPADSFFSTTEEYGPNALLLQLNQHIFKGEKYERIWSKTKECVFITHISQRTAYDLSTKLLTDIPDLLITSIDTFPNRPGVLILQGANFHLLAQHFSKLDVFSPSLIVPSGGRGARLLMDFIPFPLACFNCLREDFIRLHEEKLSNQLTWQQYLCTTVEIADLDLLQHPKDESGLFKIPIEVSRILVILTPQHAQDLKPLMESPLYVGQDVMRRPKAFVRLKEVFVSQLYSTGLCRYCKTPVRHRGICPIFKGLQKWKAWYIQKTITRMLCGPNSSALITMDEEPPKFNDLKLEHCHLFPANDAVDIFPNDAEMEVAHASTDIKEIKENTLELEHEQDNGKNVILNDQDITFPPTLRKASPKNQSRPSNVGEAANKLRSGNTKISSQKSITTYYRKKAGGKHNSQVSSDVTLVEVGSSFFNFRDVPADGDCFFHCLKQGLDIESPVISIRYQIASFIVDHRDQF